MAANKAKEADTAYGEKDAVLELVLRKDIKNLHLSVLPPRGLCVLPRPDA